MNMKKVMLAIITVSAALVMTACGGNPVEQSADVVSEEKEEISSIQEVREDQIEDAESVMNELE